MNPVRKLQELLAQEVALSGYASMCLSTLGLAAADEESTTAADALPAAEPQAALGFPNSRFVSLKLVLDDGGLVFGTSALSVKGREFGADSRAAAAMWWQGLGVQVRVRGSVQRESEALSNELFAQRGLAAQAVSHCSQQSEELQSPASLKKRVEARIHQHKQETTNPNGDLATRKLDRPAHWWAYKILPHEIEILHFDQNRFQDRSLYTKHNEQWTQTKLQP